MLMSPASAKKKPTQQPPSPPAETAPTADTTGQTAATIAAEQPVTLPLVTGELGWIKRCLNKDAPDECLVDGGFALDHGLPPTMEVSILTGGQGSNHPITILVPLDLRLQAGFAVTVEGSKEAFVGTYSTCRTIGCYGQVVLDDASYDAFLKAKSIGVIVSNMSGRSVQMTAPLEGMTEAVAQPAMTPEEMTKRYDAAKEKVAAAVRAREDAAKARLAEADKGKQDKAAGPADLPATKDSSAASEAAVSKP